VQKVGEEKARGSPADDSYSRREGSAHGRQ
jgi:hypothetical protein